MTHVVDHVHLLGDIIFTQALEGESTRGKEFTRDSRWPPISYVSVSYTHLTLPTIYSV